MTSVIHRQYRLRSPEQHRAHTDTAGAVGYATARAMHVHRHAHVRVCLHARSCELLGAGGATHARLLGRQAGQSQSETTLELCAARAASNPG